MSNSLRPHGLQHARFSCSSPTPRAYSNSYPLSWWCHPTISSSVIPFSSCLQSFPASGSFPMSQFFPSGGQSIEALASVSVLPMNIKDWFPLGWTGWISWQSKGHSSVFSNTIVQKHQFFSAGVQPRQGPGDTLRMNGVGERERERERRHVRPALIGPSLRGRERERDRETRRGVQQSLAGSDNRLFFAVAFIP